MQASGFIQPKGHKLSNIVFFMQTELRRKVVRPFNYTSDLAAA